MNSGVSLKHKIYRYQLVQTTAVPITNNSLLHTRIILNIISGISDNQSPI